MIKPAFYIKQAGLSIRYELLPHHARPMACALLGKGPPRQMSMLASGAKPGESPPSSPVAGFNFARSVRCLEVWAARRADLHCPTYQSTDVAPIIQFNEVELSR